MQLSAGTRLGPYEIVDRIGAGGMGTVYRARDTRLDRTVAIKIAGAQFSERFDREARLIAALNHPHICQIYDVGPNYLVMEYIDGKPLKGPLPLEQVQRYGAQICDALEAAHKKGIVHRDLKPANILVTRSGVKLLDFGLAKFEVKPAPDDATQTIAITKEHTLLGTLAYMSPEQLQGGEADARSDIFALGLVLYELLTGRQAFEATSQASLIAAVLKDEPREVEKLPAPLDYVIGTCLAKTPDDRWQSVRDLKRELLRTPVGAPKALRTGLPWPWMAATGLLGSIAVILAVLHFREPVPANAALKLQILPPEKSTFDTVALSPDGRRIAFTAIDASGNSRLWVRQLDLLTPRLLARTEGAYSPFWSPDGRSIGFFAEGRLKKIDAAGGPPQTLCGALGGRGGSWNRHGEILFARGASPLYRISEAGGEPKPATTLEPDRHETSHRWPAFLPDGRHFLYTVVSSQHENAGIFLASLDSPERTRLSGDESNAVYATFGDLAYLLFARGGSLLAQQVAAGKLIGEPHLIAEQVGYSANEFFGTYAVSANGVLLYGVSDQRWQSQLTWFDRSGRSVGLVGEPGRFVSPRLSPDDRLVAVERSDTQKATFDLWLLELGRGYSTRFTFGSSNEALPVWSPDGSRLAFASDSSGTFDLFTKALSGAAKEELLFQSSLAKYPDDWSRDGKFLLFHQRDPNTDLDLWVIPLTGDRKPVLFLGTESNEEDGVFSPDGKWIVYTSNESGRREIYVQAFPGGGGKRQISGEGGSKPRWRRDSRELYYVSADRKMMAVEVRLGNEFEAGAPKPLFPLQRADPLANYTVSGDGQRFLIPTLVGEAEPTPATVVIGWAQSIRP